MASIWFIDLETNNNKYFGAIASPRHPDNFVVMVGTACEETPFSGVIETAHYPTKESVPAQWLNIPDDVWLIVAHNAPYEMDWFLFQQRPQIQAYLKRGGRVFCTAYAEYLLSHQLETYPSLEETAQKYGGTPKVDGIKILWQQGVLTKDIDPVLLKEYLSGPNGDVENTRKVFYGQYARLVEAGMWNMCLERCEGMLFNCFAMNAGLYVNKGIAFDQLEKQNDELQILTDSFEHYRSHIPDYVKFNPGSDFHSSAWLFGGPIKYTGKVQWLNDDGTPKYEKADFVRPVGSTEFLQLNDDGNIIMEATAILPAQLCPPELYDFDYRPLERYKSGKNKGQIKVFREDTAVLKMKNADMQFLCGPLVDLELLPKNIQKEFHKEFDQNRTLADESKVISSGKDCLDMLALRKEFPEHVTKVLVDLQAWAKLDKDIGTYYLREEFDDAGNVTKQAGMLQFMTPQSTVYHVLNCTATVTSRLSSNRPNLQNIPRGDTSDVKKMFTSRFDDALWLAYAVQTGQVSQEVYDQCCAGIAAGEMQGFIVEADYAAIEVVSLCAFSKDTALTKALLDGIDMHCLRLSGALKEPYESVLLKCKDETHPDHLAYSIKRTLIKPKAFAYQYGATAFGIAFATGCTVEEAQDFIDTEKATFPEVESFYDDKITPVVIANTVQHREQADDGSWQMYGRGHWQSPGGTCYSFRQYLTNTKVGDKWVKQLAYKPTQIRNYPIQGESGFFMQGMTGKIIRWLVACDFFGGLVHVINTVHDAVYLDCHKSVLDVVCAGVKAIMESLPEHFNTNFGYTLHVPFPVAIEFGRSMHEKIHWHEGVLNEDKVREKLGWPVLAHE